MKLDLNNFNTALDAEDRQKVLDWLEGEGLGEYIESVDVDGESDDIEVVRIVRGEDGKVKIDDSGSVVRETLMLDPEHPFPEITIRPEVPVE